MPQVPRLPAGILRPILEHVDRVGYPRSPRAGRLAARLDDPTLLVPYTAVSGLFSDLLAAGAGEEIGLRDAANFTRAFRRWAGVSPRAYRRGLSRQLRAS